MSEASDMESDVADAGPQTDGMTVGTDESSLKTLLFHSIRDGRFGVKREVLSLSM